jgi:uncharacterized protein YukE
MLMKIGSLGILIGLICTLETAAQDYQAVKGSPFAGSVGVADNPASILSTPYPWDITVFSTQIKNTTNAISFSDFSYLSQGDTLGYRWANGEKKRYAGIDYNVHLLNVRLDLGKKQAISFGANLRGYTSVSTGKFFYNDSITSINSFLSLNENNTFKENLVSSSWLELYGTYSKTILDDERGRLNAGVTLKAMRGVSGIYAQLNGGTVNRSIDNFNGSLTDYSLAAGNAKYGYSANYDYWHSNQSTYQNLKDFVGHTQGGAAVDIGFEYMVKPQYVKIYGDPDDYYEYVWKFGAALLDFGENMYVYGTQSRSAANPNSNATDLALNNKFDNVGTLAQFNDSLATIVSSISAPSGKFKIWNPTRFEFNADRMLPEHFAVNANLTLNMSGVAGSQKRLFTSDFTLLAVTPRWETKSLGAYLPLQVTTEGRVWLGGAFKAGPLLLGLHNWANLFSKNKLQNGGFYLAIVIKPGKGWKVREEKRYTCPTN